ncbi:MAG TPA: diguanylate cyclase [Gammaproteobacteria bacterium]
MAAQTPPTPSSFPNSPYAAELRRRAGRRFSPEVEAEYIRHHLRGHAIVIRVSCVLGALLAFRRFVELLTTATPAPAYVALVGIVLAISLLLASLVFGGALERYYLPAARIGVPLRNGIGAIAIAATTVHGQPDALMLLPLMVVGPFFFLGIPFWNALLAVAVTIAAYVVAAVVLELPFSLISRSCVLLLMAAGACTIAAWHLERWSRKSFLEHGLVAELAEHDALTGLNNRRVFDERMTQLWQRATADGKSIAILLIDVDHFKAYNDLYGHQAGDYALRAVAQTLKLFVTRPHDVIVRYGGEEFAAILYDVDRSQAETLAERMRRAIFDLALEHRGSHEYGKVTISVGVALVDPSLQRRSRGALQLADQALYEAKLHGRNRVHLKDQAEHVMLITGIFEEKRIRNHGT